MTTIEQMEHRLILLEREAAQTRREARRYRRLSLAMGLGLAAGVCIAAASYTPVADVVQARRFEVVDAAGNLVLAASANEKGGQLDLWTARGKNVWRATCNDHGGDLALWNVSDINVFGAFATESGGEVAVWNATGARVLRAHSDLRGGRLDVHDVKDRPIVSTSIGQTGGVFTLANDHGSLVFEVDATGAASGGIVSVNDGSGNARFVAAAGPTGGVSQWINSSEGVAASIGSGESGGFVNALNAQGTKSVAIATQPDGGGRIDIGNDHGDITFTVNATEDAGSALTMLNRSGKKQIMLGTRPEGGLLNILSGLGVPVFIAGYDEGGRGGAVSILNGRGIQVFNARANEKEDGRISVWNADGKKPRSLIAGE